MNVGFVAFDGLTTLDLVGAWDALRRLDGVTCRVHALSPEVRGHDGLLLRADVVGGALACDVLVVPGGLGTRTLMHDAAMTDWLRSTTAGAKASVCTGALLLGAAGFLTGRRATTHPSAFELLAPMCREVVRDQRVVDEGDIITARGVTAAIDLGLHLCARLGGAEQAARIRGQMDWPY